MRLHERTQAVEVATTNIAIALDQMQRQYDLTDIEMLRALTAHQQSMLKYMVREERHPDEPDREADLA